MKLDTDEKQLLESVEAGEWKWPGLARTRNSRPARDNPLATVRECDASQRS